MCNELKIMYNTLKANFKQRTYNNKKRNAASYIYPILKSLNHLPIKILENKLEY